MICPKCGGSKLQAIYTQNVGALVNRVRRCRDCGMTTETMEIPIFENKLTMEEIKEYEDYIYEEIARKS